MLCLAAVTAQTTAAKVKKKQPKLVIHSSKRKPRRTLCELSLGKTRKTVNRKPKTKLEKHANREKHQNQKTVVLKGENRTKNWPHPQNRKMPTPPSYRKVGYTIYILQTREKSVRNCKRGWVLQSL